jgi:threonine synthase
LGDFLILRAVRESQGTCVAVSDRASLEAGARLAAADGVFAAPEGAACFAALDHLLKTGFLQPDEKIVVYNPRAGLKYLEAYSTLVQRNTESEADKLGGLITPR